MPSAESFSSRRSVCKRACSRLAGWRRSVHSQAESPTTLTTSLGQSLVIQKSPMPVSGGQQAASLAEIRRAGERARELVDQILTFGRRGEGRRERLSVRALVAETRALLAASLPSHVKSAVSEKTQTTTAWAEPAQLQQVILNLCNNAAQAMNEPGLIEL